jgi:hypothetical protein
MENMATCRSRLVRRTKGLVRELLDGKGEFHKAAFNCHDPNGISVFKQYLRRHYHGFAPHAIWCGCIVIHQSSSRDKNQLIDIKDAEGD